MNTDVQLLLDDKSNMINYRGGKWNISSDVRWFGGTSTSPQFASDDGTNTTDALHFLDVTFEGTSIAFIGNTPSAQQSQNVTVTIDSGASYNSSYGDPSPPNYLQWYQSPLLADGKHKITLERVVGTSLDFVVITAGPKTVFDATSKIVVDDNNPEIKYSGSWARSEDPFISSENPGGFPFHNGTHQSSTPGDTATFKFAGSSIAVYGIFSWAQTGSLSVTYSLDGGSTANTYSVTPATPEFINQRRQCQNYLLFSNDSLGKGNHTLVIDITQVNGLTFSMDYLTYTPSFSAIILKPDLTQLPPTTSPAPMKSSEAPPVGAVVGAVIGTLVFLSVIIFTLLILRRQRARAEGDIPSKHFSRGSSYDTDPIDNPDPPMVQHIQRSRSLDLTAPGTSLPPPEPRPSSSHIPNIPHRLIRADKLSPPTPPSEGTGLTHRQREIQRRMQELDSLIIEQGRPSQSGDNTGDAARQIAQLRTQIDELVQENAILGGLPPPAYELMS
ncbi:hypothetical protein BD779DRAFT_1654995 [Infundibulicybe gibba]|nr:hypothetical protein BD779DRAFT_1654995 [Infundibulicybe gibba]